MRFKTDTGDQADTRRLILVSLVGPSVGSDVAIRAIVATACARSVIYLPGRELRIVPDDGGESRLFILSIWRPATPGSRTPEP